MKRHLWLPILLAGGCVLRAATLEVGPGKPYARIEAANEDARPGDVIIVHARPDNRPYEKVAVQVTRPKLTFRAAPAAGSRTVPLSGKSGEYSGRGKIPRAIFQFNPGADGGVLQGFELFGARNATHNGAGVRIHRANDVTVRNCRIHHNDMGIMSNGDGTPRSGVNQLIEHCHIHHNGSHEDPGYNHNLYLGGTSVTLRFNRIHHSLTGHNIKSRAHHTRVLYCHVHHSANRELDLVESADTERPHSHAVLMGNVIEKDPACKGNRAVVHFGREKNRKRPGTLFMLHNTVITPFVSPVLELSSPDVKAVWIANHLSAGNREKKGQRLVIARKGGRVSNLSGRHNAVGAGFTDVNKTSLTDTLELPPQQGPRFRRHKQGLPLPVSPFPAAPTPPNIDLPPFPGEKGDPDPPLTWEIAPSSGKRKRTKTTRPTLGAHAL